MITFSALAAAFRGHFGLDHPFAGAAGGLLASIHQGSPCQVKIGQSDQREHLRGVLGDPLVAHLRVAELALDHPKHMLDPCADRGHSMIVPTDAV